MSDIHPTAFVSDGAVIGDDVTIGPFTIVHPNCEIGPGTTIESHCVIGYPTGLAAGRPLRIGAGSLVRSHSVMYEGSTFGDRLVTGHRVTLREGLDAGVNLSVGTLSDLQGDTAIGDYVRMHSNVHVGKFSRIGSFAWIYPYVVLTNDPHPPSDGPYVGADVGDYAVIATMVCVAPGVRIGARALIGAASMVTRDVPDGQIAYGVPARVAGDASQVMRRDGSGEPAYPWTNHFHRGYPPDIVAAWMRERDG